MAKSKLKKILTNTTMSCLVATSLFPYNALATTPSPIAPLHQESGTVNLTPEQIAALNQISIGGPKISPAINTSSANPVRVIVEFKQSPAKVAVMQALLAGEKTTLTEEKQDVTDTHKEFRSFIEGLSAHQVGINAVTADNAAGTSSDIQITHEYQNALNGVAMTLPGTMVERLFDSGLVSHVLTDDLVKLDPKEQGSVKELSGVEGTNENSIPLPGIDSLHNEGIKGNGIKVGVLDTGIDYNHPDLTDAYKGYRKQEGVDPKTINPNSVKGWDFVDNDADPMETTLDDWVNAGKPVTPGHEYPTYHGTHVSGTIAAQAKASVDFPAQGVAPDVDLYVYRVLGPYGSGYSSGIVGGIDKSVADGMKVINMSLGAPSNDPLSAEAIAVNNATLAGVTCVISAGNSGPEEWTLGTPGAAALPITVGASDFSMSIPTASATVGNETFTNFKLLGKGYNDHVETLENQTYPVVYVGLGGEDDFKNIDLHGKIALIERGTYALGEKIVNAQKAGAVAAIMYNNINGDIDNYLASDIGFIPTFRMSKADGERLKAAAENASITFTKIGSTVTEGNHLAAFSSRGPVTTSYDIKPDVVAPGVSVYSTYPEYIHSPEPGIDYSTAYARISGTSMAAPHVAGIAALILQANPTYKPADVKAALMNSADKLNGNYSVYEVGAGEVDVKEAVHNDVSFKVQDTTLMADNRGAIASVGYEKGALTFGAVYKQDGSTIKSNRTFKVKNSGSQDKTFDITTEYIKPNSEVSDSVTNNVTVTTSIPSVTVAAGQTTNVTATINVPGSAEMGRYEGYVNVVNHNNADEHYRIPFAARLVEKGLGEVEFMNPAISEVNWTPAHPFMAGPNRYIRFRLNSPMKTTWAIIYDKDGKALGATSSKPFNMVGAPLDTDLKILFTPTYYPFIGDPKDEKTDINAPMATLPEGDYSVKLRAIGEDAVTYEVSNQKFIIDNTLPKLTLKDHEPGVYELSDSDFTDEKGQDGNMYHAYWVHANLWDEGTGKLAPLGFNQSENKLWYYQNQKIFPNGDFPLDANGDTKFGIEKSDIENGPTTVTLFPMDMATNAHLLNEFYTYAFVKEGTPYVVPTYDKKKVYLGDTLKMTLNLNNVKELMSGNYNVNFYKRYLQFQNVTVNPAFKQYADNIGLTVNVDQPTETPDPIYTENKSVVNVGASITGDSTFKGISGDTPFLDVTFKLIDDDFNILDNTMNGEDNTVPFTYTQYGEQQPVVIQSFNQINRFKIIPKHSHIQSFAKLQAFQNNWTMDYTTIGVKAYAQLSDGTKVPGTIDKYGYVDIQQIPLSKDPVNIVIEAPGHLKSIQPLTLGDKTTWGEEIGVFKYVAGTQKYAAAGDVNGDGVIDVLDVKQVAKKFGVQKPSPFNIEDLNQDGIVNATDMNYLVGNLYKANPDATITPKEMVDGKYSTDYFNVLGLSTRVNTLKETTKTNQTATLNWLAAVDATNVIIEKSTDGVTWTAATTASPVAVDSNTAVVTGLNPNTEYQFRVNVTGGLNNGGSNVVKVTTNATQVTPPIDPPVTPPVPKAPIINVIDDNDTTITGTADANVNIAVKNNGAEVATGKANAEGNYSIEISPQKAGTVLTVSATNAAGDQSEATSITVLDRTAPNAPKINAIDDNDTTISGSTEANATIVVKNNDVVVATGKANDQGNYSFTIDTQKAGTVLTVNATDAAGNQSEVTSITVVDRTAPNAPKINTIDDNDTKISGSTEANATIVVKNNGKTIATGNADTKGAFSFKIKQQKAGSVLTVTATDKSGNVSAASKIKVLDKTAPKAPKIKSFIIVKNKTDIQIIGTAEANSTIIVKNGYKVVATVKVSSKGTFTVKLSKVGKGKKNITLLAVDNAGNKSFEVKRTVTIK
jgi:subtilisin family serine protease